MKRAIQASEISLESVRRCLFGLPNRRQVLLELAKILESEEQRLKEEWNFDFRLGCPLPPGGIKSRYEWSRVASEDPGTIPDFFRSVSTRFCSANPACGPEVGNLPGEMSTDSRIPSGSCKKDSKAEMITKRSTRTIDACKFTKSRKSTYCRKIMNIATPKKIRGAKLQNRTASQATPRRLSEYFSSKKPSPCIDHKTNWKCTRHHRQRFSM